MRRLLLASLIPALLPAVSRADEFLLKGGECVVFLGDSNTFGGKFIAYLDAYLFTRYPDRRFELINLGLPSETVSGLSEPDHPYPRPNVHDRLDRALLLTKPNVVVACYGMNDGIYYPFSEERFKQYQAGYRKLIDAVKKAGAKLILMTPAPFDPAPLKDKVLPEGAAKYSWMRPYRDYDQVLTRYSEWLVSLRKDGFVVADPHTALLKHLTAMRRTEPGYRVSGDGIHPDANGHAVIYQDLLRALSGDTRDRAVEFKEGAEVRLGGELSVPADAGFHKRLFETEPLNGGLNRYRLKANGLTAERYTVSEGEQKLGVVERQALAAGLEVGTALPKLSPAQRAVEVTRLAEQRATLLGRAWLDEVGHKRPDTPKGTPLAQAQAKAKELEEKIRKLAGPAGATLRLLPVKE